MVVWMSIIYQTHTNSMLQCTSNIYFIKCLRKYQKSFHGCYFMYPQTLCKFLCSVIQMKICMKFQTIIFWCVTNKKFVYSAYHCCYFEVYCQITFLYYFWIRWSLHCFLLVSLLLLLSTLSISVFVAYRRRFDLHLKWCVFQKKIEPFYVYFPARLFY